MSPQTHSNQSKSQSQQPTSPWTEVFQQSQAATRADRERARAARRHAAGSDDARATHDALSVIFKQD
jgi:hypothetical protein